MAQLTVWDDDLAQAAALRWKCDLQGGWARKGTGAKAADRPFQSSRVLSIVGAVVRFQFSRRAVVGTTDVFSHLVLYRLTGATEPRGADQFDDCGGKAVPPTVSHVSHAVVDGHL